MGNKINKEPRSERDSFNRKLMLGAGTILVTTVCLIVGIVAATTMTPKDPDATGLKNPNHLTDPKPVTGEDLEEEYNSRPTIDPETPDVWRSTITKFLSRGDYEGLDSYLQEEMAKYKNLEGDEGQAIEDWRSQFEMLRADVARAANITKDGQPEITLTQFGDPEILAAAVIWSPVSVKLEAFVDYSSIILPNPESGDINLRAVDPNETSKLLQEVNKMSFTRYMDLAAYDATVFGYELRIILVTDQLGYYRPWSIEDINHDVNRDVWSKTPLKAIKNSLDPYSDLDSVLTPPQKTEDDIEYEVPEDEGFFYPDETIQEAPEGQSDPTEGQVEETPEQAEEAPDPTPEG